jgi:tripartite-type tricarboxylate transporter receptor subunit TctC
VSLYPNLAYKPDVDFEPIGEVIEVPIVIVARKNFPANDLKEFMAYVRRPGRSASRCLCISSSSPTR